MAKSNRTFSLDPFGSPTSPSAMDCTGAPINRGDVVEIVRSHTSWLPQGHRTLVEDVRGDVLVIRDTDRDMVGIPSRFVKNLASNSYINPEHTAARVDATAAPNPKKTSISIDSVIMPEEKKTSIRAALSQVQNHSKIFDEWGFGETFEKGTAISMLFWGVPGTGKTLMAQAIADQIGAELKLYGAAEIETSEPGGAERNIQNIFKEAQKESAKRVILFDECDSLLMDRNTVGPIIAATINCLLSEIERYAGVVIFTTNRLGKLDPALERRLSAKIEFEFPDQAAREKIWRRMIPKKAPLEKDVDFTVLSQTAIAGGNIKNAVLNAARQAVFEGSKKIAQRHFESAAKTELASRHDFQKAADSNDHTRLTDFTREGRSGITITRSAAQRFAGRGRNGAS